MRVCGRQKARLLRLQQSKLAARRAIAEGTRRFDEWQRRCGQRAADATTTPSDRRDAVVTRSSMDGSAGQPLAKKDLFDLQHCHLLKCLEHTTVIIWICRGETFKNESSTCGLYPTTNLRGSPLCNTPVIKRILVKFVNRARS